MPFPFLWSRLRTRSAVERELAVANVRVELLELENADLRTRVGVTDTEYRRFRDQVFARFGAITSPVAMSTAPSQAPPLASVFSNLSVSSIRDHREGFPAPVAMDS